MSNGMTPQAGEQGLVNAVTIVSPFILRNNKISMYEVALPVIFGLCQVLRAKYYHGLPYCRTTLPLSNFPCRMDMCLKLTSESSRVIQQCFCGKQSTAAIKVARPHIKGIKYTTSSATDAWR